MFLVIPEGLVIIYKKHFSSVLKIFIELSFWHLHDLTSEDIIVAMVSSLIFSGQGTVVIVIPWHQF